jgi:hypothetical protein
MNIFNSENSINPAKMKGKNRIMYFANETNVETTVGNKSINSKQSQPKITDNKQTMRSFFRLLYGNNLQKGHIVIWTKQDRGSYFFSPDEIDEGSEKSRFLCRNMDVYYGVGLQKEEAANGGRGTADSVVTIPGLWLDIDIHGPNHSAENLPPDKDSVFVLLKSFKLKPTIIVSTGGGFHLYWLFDQPMVIENDSDRKQAQSLSSNFQAVFRKLAAEKGWTIDITSDLSRILRLPGTFNHKQGEPMPVEIFQINESSRYDPEVIAESLKEYPITVPRQSTNEPEKILEGTRNSTLTKIGGKLRGQGLEYKNIYQELSGINGTRCMPPLSDDEVEIIANSVSEYPANSEKSGKKPNQSQRLIQLTESMRLFHTPDMEGYAEISVNEHSEIWPLKSKEFKHYLSKAYYDQYGKPPGSQGLQNALAVLQGNAQFNSPENKTHVRLAGYKDSIFLDLCNDSWEAVEIDSNGWKIVKNPPVSFRRPRGMLALPKPEHGGDINELRHIINVKKESDWVLIIAWLIGSFSPAGPYPILLVHGEQGSAKSTTARILRELLDPSAAPLRTLPRSERDLMIMAKNGWIIAFDNLSGVKPWLSDALCRLSTGGGFSTRGLHTDSDEVIFDAERPMLMNGIDNIANRQDLASRSLIINLPRIPAKRRKLEQDIWKEFDNMKPRILGSILDTVSFVLRNIQNVHLNSYPRMADFAKWIVAAEPFLPWKNGKFETYYQVNQKESAFSAFESDNVAMAIKKFVETNKEWEGTATELKDELESYKTYEEFTTDKSWPKMPNYLSNRVSRIADSLRSVGIDVEQSVLPAGLHELA